MERLVRLINCLRPAEAQLIKAFYKARFLGKSNRRLQLLNLLLEGKVKDNESASHIIYHQKSDSTLSQLKKRVREDILNFILLSPPHKLYSSILNQIELTCRKSLIQGKILISRGAQEEGVRLLHKARKLAEKYELPEITVAVYDTLRTNASLRSRAKSLSEYHWKINKALKIYQELLKAKEVAWDVNKAMEAPGSQPTVPAEPTNATPDSNGSNKITFWFKMAALKYHVQHQDFIRSGKLAQELLEMIERRPFLCSSVTRIGLHMECCKISMQLGQWNPALAQGKLAYELCNPHTLVQYYTLEMMFLVYFQQSEYQLAQDILKQLRDHYQVKVFGQIQFKWPVYQGALEFRNGQYKASLKSIHAFQEHRDFRKNLLPVKLLEILNIIELADTDWLEFKLDAFRKAIYQSATSQTQRYRHICQILLSLVRHNFDYPLVMNQQQDKLLQLNVEVPCQWDPTGSELVNFTDWFHSKTDFQSDPKVVSSVNSPQLLKS